MDWVEVSIKTSAETVEIASNILYDAGAGGVVIEDPRDIVDLQHGDANWDYVDEELLKQAVEDRVVVKGYLPHDTDLYNKIEEICAKVADMGNYGLDAKDSAVVLADVHEEDWANNWKQYYKPTRVGVHIVIKPTWESYMPAGDDIVVELDPGMAFGTGTHESTMLCLELLESHMIPDSSIIDVGCGSGVLSIAAAKLGAKKVLALDVDPVAVRVASENAKLNCVEDIVEVRKNDLLDGFDVQVDIIIANIVADVIIRLLPQIPPRLKKPGLFIASGIIKERADDVKAAVESMGFTIEDVADAGEWVAFVCRR